jgi:hypothetical protein
MSEEMIAVLVVAAIAVVVVIVAMALLRRRHRRRAGELQERFGPEYDRMVGDADGRRARRSAERSLTERAEARDRLDIRPLGPGARDRYAARWRDTQATFVDSPESALTEADALLSQVMSERGYPVDGFEEQAALISVDHPDLVENYRHAHSLRTRIARGDADTEAMRDAMLRYRSLFDELLAPEETRVS